MWLYVSGGFVSIVAHRTEPEHLLVRARHPKHIASILPDANVTHMPSADYPYRTVARRGDVHRALTEYLLNLDYDNFKNSVPDPEYHDACRDVWRTMWSYGNRYRNRGGV